MKIYIPIYEHGNGQPFIATEVEAKILMNRKNPGSAKKYKFKELRKAPWYYWLRLGLVASAIGARVMLGEIKDKS